VSPRSGASLAALLLGALTACQPSAPAGGGGSAPATSSQGDEIAALIEKGDAEGALARLQGSDDPHSLYLQGRAWAKKAETAPLPTPMPLTSPLPRGAAPPSRPEFKPEERKAIELYERAIAARPDLSAARVALAQILAPHAIRFQERVQEAKARQQAALAARRRGQPSPEPLPTPEPGVDYSAERVVGEFREAIRSDPGRAPVEAMIAFAVKAGRLEDAEVGYQELTRRVKESGEPLALYGDFLVNEKKDPAAAVEQYRQALIWSPDDSVTRSKLAGIFLKRGADYLNQQQYASAEAQLNEAAKYIPDRDSAQGRLLAEQQAKLREIRSR
jgi:tetratricopeptide (TPR) repeat protein